MDILLTNVEKLSTIKQQWSINFYVPSEINI